MAEEERERQDDATEPGEPRWSGAAPVPPPAPKRKRWLEDESVFPPPPPPPAEKRDPTLSLPTSYEPDTPVDPWGDVDPLPSYPVDLSYPPTRVEPPVPPPVPHAPPPVSHVPPPLPVPVPPVQVRKARKAKRPEPAGPPPGWRPPPGYVAVPVRRRRRWPWFALLSLLCCCGCPAWFGQPIFAQYPAESVTPSVVGGLTLRDDAQSRTTTKRLTDELNKAYLWKESTFAGVYVDGDNKRATVYGTTGFHLSPDGDVVDEITRVTSSYRLRDVRTVDATDRGESRRCGVGVDNGADVVVCSWADHGSLGTGVFTRLGIDDSNARLSQLRDTIVTRKSAG
ncbi:hypothetical protein SAMN05421812_105382 [Asanoa hainanensis]|uniref:Uncharacterized protein n=1 Tax=Asanoa hainanensis TaxID=560556 RepID=A0A239MG77_9ACTN|nr:hypothetical protein [Asanoa hainanensis]SNT40958.1 hypothetical protein SAMN05421812_105382 [Asanoa hainanensis]